MKYQETETIQRILRECRTIAVVGLSSNPLRPSNGVAVFMKKNGYAVIAVNPNESEVFGEKAVAKLSDIDETIDLVDIFRRSQDAGEIVDEAVAVGAKAVWMQEGVIDENAARRAEAAGLLVVMDRCWLKDYLRYGE